MNLQNELIITAASKAFAPSLLALLGSLNLNWREHPPVLVYDIGLDDATLATLAQHNINVKRVPPFCPHWRKHFAWKIWCWQDAPAQKVLWLDAGLVILKPLTDIFEMLNQRDYFVVTTKFPLAQNSSAAACRGCGVPPEFRENKTTLAGGLFGFRRTERMDTLLGEALQATGVEEYIAATEPLHRHDQAILSLLMYKHFGVIEKQVLQIYLEGNSPRISPAQKVWVHRRTLAASDQRHFAAHISATGAPYMPRPTFKLGMTLRLYLIQRWLGARNARFIYDGVRD